MRKKQITMLFLLIAFRIPSQIQNNKYHEQESVLNRFIERVEA